MGKAWSIANNRLNTGLNWPWINLQVSVCDFSVMYNLLHIFVPARSRCGKAVVCLDFRLSAAPLDMDDAKTANVVRS